MGLESSGREHQDPSALEFPFGRRPAACRMGDGGYGLRRYLLDLAEINLNGKPDLVAIRCRYLRRARGGPEMDTRARHPSDTDALVHALGGETKGQTLSKGSTQIRTQPTRPVCPVHRLKM